MAMDFTWSFGWGFAATLVTTLLVIRIVWILQSTGKALSKRDKPMRTLVVLGSGGHTAEILNLVEAMNLQRYAPRHYIAGATDAMSLERAQRVEKRLLQGVVGDEKSKYSRIFRSREVGQSYFTSIFTTLWAFAHAMFQVLRIQPDVILCNGPGTCLPLCVAGFLLKVVGWRRVVVVYVESIARVKKLSLTGLLLYKLRLADQLFVQWAALKVKYPRANYVGRLM